jgi:hypothetical protein
VGVLWDTKGNGLGYDANWFNSFPAKAVEGLQWLFELLLAIAHFSKAKRKMILAWLLLSMRILVKSHLSMWTVMTIVSVCGNGARLMSWAEKVIGMWNHLVWLMGLR